MADTYLARLDLLRAGRIELADTLDHSIVQSELDDAACAFIEERDFFFLTTVSSEGEPTVSHKGGPKGTVKVLDPQTLVFPAYDGNGMFLSLGNIADTGKIGLLFMDFETPHRVRVQASATIVQDQSLLAAFPCKQPFALVHYIQIKVVMLSITCLISLIDI